MKISTSQLFDNSVNQMNRQQSKIAEMQAKLASGNKLLNQVMTQKNQQLFKDYKLLLIVNQFMKEVWIRLKIDLPQKSLRS